MMFNRIKNKVDREDYVPKITGMLIDFEVLLLEEQLELLEDDAALE